MNTIEKLRALEQAAIHPYRTMSVLAETSSDGKIGDCRVWHGQEAGRCIAVFKHEPTARLYLESTRSLPSLLKVAEAAKAYTVLSHAGADTHDAYLDLWAALDELEAH